MKLNSKLSILIISAVTSLTKGNHETKQQTFNTNYQCCNFSYSHVLHDWHRNKQK